jgi:PilZ domain
VNRNTQKKGLMARLLSSIDFLVSRDLSTEDRRSVPRLGCQYEVRFINERGKPGQGELIDVSSKGLRLRTPGPLAKGLTLALNSPEDENLDRFPPLMARVVWSIREQTGTYQHGLMLPLALEEEETWLDHVLQAMGYTDGGSQRRQHIRAEAEIDGLLVLDEDPTARKVSVAIQNLGMGGALLRCPETLPKNSQFALTIGPFDDLPEVALAGTILRVTELPHKGYTLHPARFRPLESLGERVLREYILKLIGNE